MNQVNLSRATLDEADISLVNCHEANFVEASLYTTNMFRTSADRLGLYQSADRMVQLR